MLIKCIKWSNTSYFYTELKKKKFQRGRTNKGKKKKVEDRKKRERDEVKMSLLDVSESYAFPHFDSRTR